ncbi:hypothetical protein LPJ56_007246, partial [Coemansia sp. RSA 2599]
MLPSGRRVFVAGNSVKSAEPNPIVYPKTLSGKIRRFIYLIDMNTGLYVLDPWERKIA